MAIDERGIYSTNSNVLGFADLNRWSINGSPQYLTQTVMSGATTQSFQGVFNLYPDTAYSNFKIIISNFRTSVAGLTLQMKLMTGASLSGSTYDQAYQQVSAAGATAYFGATGGNAWSIMRLTETTNRSSAIVDVFNPYVSLIVTGISKISGDYSAWSTSSGRHGNSNAFDGFQLNLSAAGTMSGVVTVYALRNGSA